MTLPDGHLIAGTGPGGVVIAVDDPTHPASSPDEAVKYIWDLAADPDGNLFAATGPTGQLWKRTIDGKWTLLLDSKQPHLLCVAVGKDRSIYAGSDGAGLIYRVGPDGQISVLYDAPQDEVRSLLVAPDGALYAGTAVTAGGGGSTPNRTALIAGDETSPRMSPRRASRRTGLRPSDWSRGARLLPRPRPPARTRSIASRPTGRSREVFRASALIFALAWQDDRLLVGTGQEGRLYEVREPGRESTSIARLDAGQILGLLTSQGPADGVVLAAGNPGGIWSLGDGYAEKGTLTSDVLDTKLTSRFGAVRWQAEQPAGTTVQLQLRTGNVAEPDDTWSAWSAAQRDATKARSDAPPGRFAQYRITLEAADSRLTPEVRSVSVLYQTVNLVPEVTNIDVTDPAEGDGTQKPAEIPIRWTAADPNGDTMAFTLSLRKEGWPDWVRIGGEPPRSEATLNWDSSSVPAGRYQLRVVATDRPSNPPDEALEQGLTSRWFLVDHAAPVVTVEREGDAMGIQARDAFTRIVKASYAMDSGDWTPLYPADGLFDQPAESFSISMPKLSVGTHVLRVQATDAAGNTGAGDLVFQVP